MQIAVTGEQEAVFSTVGANENIRFISSLEDLSDEDVIIDFLFDGSEERIQQLSSVNAAVAVNAVTLTSSSLPSSFVRFNGWPGFSKEFIEASSKDDSAKNTVENALLLLGKKIEWLPDQPGFISARVVSMIINEAYLTLAEGVSTKNDIDTAMKTGTNYPYGPFEWSQKIGLKHIAALLLKLAENEIRYKPAPLLLEEAGL